ncbi:uncharacterized protein LOC130719933 [Lotus japonicus]|uniref:uncharacterized protein LOC130719933 n=1 Tax=Lotus japonicus TaxID=34305 RepID=UPI0025865ED0|nr:uncharacterized protein LOC130719933 [Lotus japonicus]
MKMLSWNCRGLGNSRAVRALSRLSLKLKPQIVFLMETISYVTEFDRVKNVTGLDCCLAMNCSGRKRAGGIAMLWKSNLDVNLLSCSANHISVIVTDEWDQKWCLSGVYGYPEEENKVKTLELLGSLRSQYQGMWICLGDFNLICNSSEKSGGRTANLNQMRQFKDTLEECGLTDLGFTGFPFTWNNGRDGDQNIKERLDRCLANSDFSTGFPCVYVEHMGSYGSDHTVLAISLKNGIEQQETRVRKVLAVKEVLVPFRKEQGNLQRQIDRKERELIRIEKGLASNENLSKKIAVQKEFDDLLLKQEIYWKQRSRALWLREGDKNFFTKRPLKDRNTTTSRRLKMSRMNGFLVMKLCHKLSKVTFSRSSPLRTPRIYRILVRGPRWPSRFVLSALLGFGRGAVTSHVLDVLNNGREVADMNETYICLIPKVSKPQTPKDLRPISLCNVLMKIVTKCIANRLKCILPDLVGETQSTFIPGRLITDNALIGMEVFHYMKKKKHGKKGWMALKLDMSKAYDRIEWEFLREVLNSMNFPSHFVSLVLKCVSSVKYAILLNGEPRDWFSPHRGLRQGDPVSPYLFILCAEVFAGLIDEQVAQNNIHGIKIARGAPQISHLFFADDSLLFMRANLVEAEHVLTIIKRYEEASGQRVNFDKTELSFSQNVPEQICNQIRNRMDVKVVGSHDKYLGLPTVIGRSKKEVFLKVQERLVKKLKGWKEKYLSKAGKEVLLKSIAQAIPIYIMSCFKIPDNICDSMASQMANFWWGQKNSEKKIHWMSWANLCKPKSCGGLGFRDFRSFNEALLAKQVWRLLQREDSLLYKCLKARYFPRASLLSAPVGFRPSFAWRSICSARKIITEGSLWKVDNEQRKWRSDVVDQIFVVAEAERIKNIPLAWVDRNDLLSWRHTVTGAFTIKSAYSIILEHKVSNVASSSSLRTDCIFVWKLKIPKKVQHFIFRLVNKSLPCQHNLKRRGVLVAPICPLCGECLEETPSHIFLQCNWVRQVWFASPMSIRYGDIQVDIDKWLYLLSSAGEREVIDQVAMLLWSIWKARNDSTFKRIKPDVRKTLDMAVNMRVEWLSHQPISAKTVMPSAVWIPPPSGYMKLNFDAGWSGNRGSGFGLVIRDDKGLFQAAASHYEDHRMDPLVAEALCFRWALRLAVEWNLENLVIVSDCQQLVKAFHQCLDFPSLHQILLDC